MCHNLFNQPFTVGQGGCFYIFVTIYNDTLRILCIKLFSHDKITGANFKGPGPNFQTKGCAFREGEMVVENK